MFYCFCLFDERNHICFHQSEVKPKDQKLNRYFSPLNARMGIAWKPASVTEL